MHILIWLLPLGMASPATPLPSSESIASHQSVDDTRLGRQPEMNSLAVDETVWIQKSECVMQDVGADETVWIQRADELDEVINLQSSKFQSQALRDEHQGMMSRGHVRRNATLLGNRSSNMRGQGGESHSEGKAELKYARNRSVLAESKSESSLGSNSTTTLPSGLARLPSKLDGNANNGNATNGNTTDSRDANGSRVAGAWWWQLFSMGTADANASRLAEAKGWHQPLHVGVYNATYRVVSLLTTGFAATEGDFFLGSMWTLVVPLCLMFLICIVTVFLLMPDTEVRRSRLSHRRSDLGDLDSGSDFGRAQEARADSRSVSGYHRGADPRRKQSPYGISNSAALSKVPHPGHLQAAPLRAHGGPLAAPEARSGLSLKSIEGPRSSFIIQGSQSITPERQLMVQSIFGPHSQANDEPMATLLYMEHGDATPEQPLGSPGRRSLVTGSRVLLKHGDSTVAVLDTSATRRGERVARAHLVEDDGSIQEQVFAYITRCGPENRYMVCYGEDDAPVYLVDCPDSRTQLVTFCDTDGSVVAGMERAAQSSENEVLYIGTFNSMAADYSLVLMSWVAVIKLS